MIIFVLFFACSFYFLQGKMSIKITLATILSVYQLLVACTIGKLLRIKQVGTIFSLSFHFYPLSIIILLLLIMLCSIVAIQQIYKYEQKKYHRVGILNKKKISLSLVGAFFVFIGALCYYASVWTFDYFGNIGLDEIFYTLSQPLTGTDDGQIRSFISVPILNALALASTMNILYYLAAIYIYRPKVKPNVRTQRRFLRVRWRTFCLGNSIIFLLAGVLLGIQEFGYKEVRQYFLEKTQLYDEYYVNPSTVAIKFPEKKRNLIYIFVESLETTYLSKELGGDQEENLLPNLSQLALSEGINFSNTDALGGSLQLPGLGFTVGGMVGQSAGVPLKVTGGYDVNEYGTTSLFMPGLTSLGDILNEEGYNQTLLIGSEASFSGRDKYYTQHGEYTVKDYSYAHDAELIPQDYRVWWGYEDYKLFDFAKTTLGELSEGEEPFNLTLLTADTHFPDGYSDEKTPQLFEDQYSNVIHYTDKQLGEFLSWVKEQPFYEDTTIILSGDHLSMDTNFFTEMTPNYERTVFNLVLNAPVTPENNKNRLFSTMDLFPTTLAALGAEVEGERLGLGTNLFSTEATLTERLGYEALQDELSKGSNYYNSKIMQGSDLAADVTPKDESSTE